MWHFWFFGHTLTLSHVNWLIMAISYLPIVWLNIGIGLLVITKHIAFSTLLILFNHSVAELADSPPWGQACLSLLLAPPPHPHATMPHPHFGAVWAQWWVGKSNTTRFWEASYLHSTCPAPLVRHREIISPPHIMVGPPQTLVDYEAQLYMLTEVVAMGNNSGLDELTLADSAKQSWNLLDSEHAWRKFTLTLL